MRIAFNLLAALIAAVPILATVNTASGADLISIATATAALMTAAIPQPEFNKVLPLLQRVSLAILLPAVWMLLQIVPLPFSSIVSSIWPTAAAALDKPSLLGHISIDPGSTLRCLVAYLTLLAFVTLTAVNTQDRHRAETILFVLCIVTAVAAIENLIGKYLFLPGKAAAASYAAIGIVGVPLNIGALFLLVERHLTRGERGGSPSGSLSLKLSIGVAGAVLCAAALFNDPSPDAVMACGSGVAVLLLIILIRRFAIRAWSLGLLLGIVACLAVGAGVLRVQRDNSETMMALSTSTPSEPVVVRATPDFKWFGSGVGTFAAVAQIYRDYGIDPIVEAPSTMAAITLEWGRPALLVLFAITAQLFWFMFRGALRRGRDSGFAAIAAASLVVVFCEAFADASLTHLPVQLILAAIVGLGIAQVTGRTSGL